MNKRRGSSVNIGFSSIMMIFIMICLVTFATLSVLTANSDYRLSRRTADKTTAYYEADLLAREMSHHIEHLLFAHYNKGVDASEDYYAGITADLLSSQMPPGLSTDIKNLAVSNETGIPVITFEVSVSDVQTLYVALETNYPESEAESLFKVIQWQTKTVNAPDESDTFLHLFGG